MNRVNKAFRRFIVAALMTLALVLFTAAITHAAAVRHYIIDQLDWNNNVGLLFEIANDQAKDDVVAPLRTASINAGLGTGTRWRISSYSTSKWELNKEYTVKYVVTPELAELWVDGQRKTTSKCTFVMYDGKPEINGVPTWATGTASYGVYVKSLKITTSDGNDYEAEYDLDSWDPRLASTFPEDWRLTEYDTSFTIEVVFMFLPAE